MCSRGCVFGGGGGPKKGYGISVGFYDLGAFGFSSGIFPNLVRLVGTRTFRVCTAILHNNLFFTAMVDVLLRGPW